MQQIRAGTDSVHTAALEIASGNADLSQRTEEKVSSLEQATSSMGQCMGIIRQNTDKARQANTLAANASEVALRCGEVVGQVVQTMSGISDSSRNVHDIVGVIESIAFQTHILVLNAAVEAARAGEQGRGFAVVANEVRSLAQRSATAAKEIKELIGDSAGRVSEGVDLIERAGMTMIKVVGAVQRVTDLLGEIAATSEEQSRGTAQVHQAVSQMEAVTQQNAALAEQAAVAAHSLEKQAANLRDEVSVFKVPESGPSAPGE